MEQLIFPPYNPNNEQPDQELDVLDQVVAVIALHEADLASQVPDEEVTPAEVLMQENKMAALFSVMKTRTSLLISQTTMMVNHLTKLEQQALETEDASGAVLFNDMYVVPSRERTLKAVTEGQALFDKAAEYQNASEFLTEPTQLMYLTALIEEIEQHLSTLPELHVAALPDRESSQ